MNKSKQKVLWPMVIAFGILAIALIVSKDWLTQKGVDVMALIGANVVLFLICLLSFNITLKGLDSRNPHAFVRSIYGSFVAKFFILAIAAFVYIMLQKEGVNKPALFGFMLLYIIYSFLEVSALLRLLKQKKNA